MKRILQLDGGGVKGISTAVVLANIEKELKKPIHEIFDLIIGTSVGSIIGGILSTGKMPAAFLSSLIYDEVDAVFKPNILRKIRFINMCKYDRKPLMDILNKYVGQYYKMSECKTKFICTAVSANDGRNHYFKSWENEDGKLNLVDAINRSYAAPYYFGVINDPLTETTWLDGGTGNSNCSLDEAIVEVFNNNWLSKNCTI